jgi:hypothetical protein
MMLSATMRSRPSFPSPQGNNARAAGATSHSQEAESSRAQWSIWRLLHLERFQSTFTVTNTMDAEVRRGNEYGRVGPSVPQKDHVDSPRRVRPSGLCRNRRVCSADNEKAPTYYSKAVFFFRYVRSGRGWPKRPLGVLETKEQHSFTPFLTGPRAPGSQSRAWEGAHRCGSRGFSAVACAAAAWLPLRCPARADRWAPGCNNRAAGTPRARRRFQSRAKPGRC